MLGYKYKEVIWFRRLCISAYMGWWAAASSRMVSLGQPCCSSLVSTWFCQKPQISSCGRDCLMYDFPESFHTPEMKPEGSALIFFSVQGRQSWQTVFYSVRHLHSCLLLALTYAIGHVCLCGILFLKKWYLLIFYIHWCFAVSVGFPGTGITDSL